MIHSDVGVTIERSTLKSFYGGKIYLIKSIDKLACVAGARRGREKGNRARGEKEKEAPAASPLFISSRPFINMQTANTLDPSCCQITANQMLFTFRGNPEGANKGQ